MNKAVINYPECLNPFSSDYEDEDEQGSNVAATTTTTAKKTQQKVANANSKELHKRHSLSRQHDYENQQNKTRQKEQFNVNPFASDYEDSDEDSRHPEVSDRNREQEGETLQSGTAPNRNSEPFQLNAAEVTCPQDENVRSAVALQGQGQIASSNPEVKVTASLHKGQREVHQQQTQKPGLGVSLQHNQHVAFELIQNGLGVTTDSFGLDVANESVRQDHVPPIRNGIVREDLSQQQEQQQVVAVLEKEQTRSLKQHEQDAAVLLEDESNRFSSTLPRHEKTESPEDQATDMPQNGFGLSQKHEKDVTTLQHLSPDHDKEATTQQNREKLIEVLRNVEDGVVPPQEDGTSLQDESVLNESLQCVDAGSLQYELSPLGGGQEESGPPKPLRAHRSVSLRLSGQPALHNSPSPSKFGKTRMAPSPPGRPSDFKPTSVTFSINGRSASFHDAETLLKPSLVRKTSLHNPPPVTPRSILRTTQSANTSQSSILTGSSLHTPCDSESSITTFPPARPSFKSPFRSIKTRALSNSKSTPQLPSLLVKRIPSVRIPSLKKFFRAAHATKFS